MEACVGVSISIFVRTSLSFRLKYFNTSFQSFFPFKFGCRLEWSHCTSSQKNVLMAESSPSWRWNRELLMSEISAFYTENAFLFVFFLFSNSTLSPHTQLVIFLLPSKVNDKSLDDNMSLNRMTEAWEILNTQEHTCSRHLFFMMLIEKVK